MSTGIHNVVIQLNVPTQETRGRPASLEHRTLLAMPIGGSFFSIHKRVNLYQLARSIGIKVSITKAKENGMPGWRVRKTGYRVNPVTGLVGEPLRRRKASSPND